MAATYTPIASITLGTETTTVIFSSIPSTYTDLVLVSVGFCGADYYSLRMNSDSGANYSRTLLYTSGSSAVSTRGTNTTEVYGSFGTSSTNIGMSIHHINNYSNTTTNKTILRRSHAAALNASPQIEAGLWRNAAAINTLTLIAGSGNFSVGSKFDLYGILAGNA